MKDIFIDADIANTFANTQDSHKVELIEWLLKNKDAYLVISNALRGEYINGNTDCDKIYSIRCIYFELQKEDRINPISNEEIKKFQQQFFNWGTITCKRKGSHDPEHIACIFLSNRRMAIVKDGKFHKDLLNFHPKKKVKGQKLIVTDCASKLNYK